MSSEVLVGTDLASTKILRQSSQHLSNYKKKKEANIERVCNKSMYDNCYLAYFKKKA